MVEPEVEEWFDADDLVEARRAATDAVEAFAGRRFRLLGWVDAIAKASDQALDPAGAARQARTWLADAGALDRGLDPDVIRTRIDTWAARADGVVAAEQFLAFDRPRDAMRVLAPNGTTASGVPAARLLLLANIAAWRRSHGRVFGTDDALESLRAEIDVAGVDDVDGLSLVACMAGGLVLGDRSQARWAARHVISRTRYRSYWLSVIRLWIGLWRVRTAVAMLIAAFVGLVLSGSIDRTTPAIVCGVASLFAFGALFRRWFFGSRLPRGIVVDRVQISEGLIAKQLEELERDRSFWDRLMSSLAPRPDHPSDSVRYASIDRTMVRRLMGVALWRLLALPFWITVVPLLVSMVLIAEGLEGLGGPFAATGVVPGLVGLVVAVGWLWGIFWLWKEIIVVGLTITYPLARSRLTTVAGRHPPHGGLSDSTTAVARLRIRPGALVQLPDPESARSRRRFRRSADARVRTRSRRRPRRAGVTTTPELVEEFYGRRPAVLLREFRSDDLNAARPANRASRVAYEDVIVAAMHPIGPVVAVGEPGERFGAGAAYRTYIDTPDWLSRVQEMCAAAPVVAMIASAGDGLRDELAMLRDSSMLKSTIVVLPWEMLDEERDVFLETVGVAPLELGGSDFRVLVVAWSRDRTWLIGTQLGLSRYDYPAAIETALSIVGDPVPWDDLPADDRR